MDEGSYNISKEPWLAVVLSRLFIGVGQIYSGKIVRGIILILLEILLIFISYWFLFSDKGNIIIGASLFLLLSVIAIWNLFDAHRCAKLKNAADNEISRKENKDAWLAVFLTSIIPGLGQIYVKKRLWGTIFIIISVIIFLCRKEVPIFLIGLDAIFVSCVCYHAYFFSPIHREKTKKMILIISITIFGFGLLDYSGLIIKEFLVEAFRISTGSMSPTLVSSDRLLCKKYDKYDIKRGDVVIFRSPVEPDTPYASRLIATENETVEIKNKKVYINGLKVNLSSIDNIEYESVGNGSEVNPYAVPEGHFFVLGDNSKNSYDSRFYGSVPNSNLIGRAYKIYWPPKRIGVIE
jgi:signal peptidase I